jgi:hypothetical protein
MKKSISFLVALLLCAGNIGLCQQNAAETEIDRDAAIKAFAELTSNAKTGLKANDAMATAKSGGKFGVVAPVNVSYTGGNSFMGGCNNALRVWFELSDGRYVKPHSYRWAPGEVFYVHVQSAVPVYVVLYQNFGNGSRRVYPDARFAESFQMLMPGVDTRLPVAFQMDINYRPEQMSIVVTRADWDGIRADVPQAAPAAVAVATASAGDVYATATAVAGILKSAGIDSTQAEIRSDKALAKFSVINSAGLNNTEYDADGIKCRVRYHVSAPRFVRPTSYVHFDNRRITYRNVTNVTNINYVNYRGCYHNIDDAALYLFSDNGVGYLQVTLNKVGSNWRWNW